MANLSTVAIIVASVAFGVLILILLVRPAGHAIVGTIRWIMGGVNIIFMIGMLDVLYASTASGS